MMRSLDQLKERKWWYSERIQEMEAEDQMFPDDPIHENDVKHFRSAVEYLDRRISEVSNPQ